MDEDHFHLNNQALVYVMQMVNLWYIFQCYKAFAIRLPWNYKGRRGVLCVQDECLWVYIRVRSKSRDLFNTCRANFSNQGPQHTSLAKPVRERS